MAENNLTKSTNINVTAREIDFVTRFGLNWQALMQILGIMRPIKKVPGAVLKSKHAAINLESGTVGEGETIPLSLASVTEKTYAEMDIEKYAKAVSIEAIKDHGYDYAVGKTDDAFLIELQNKVMNRFYTYLNTGELTNIQTSFQAAVAMAKGLCVNKWKKMHRDVTEVVGFANVLDVYEYLASASITIQNAFGMDYVQNFMGFNTIFLLSDDQIARGTVIATPVENIVLYYVDPAQSDFARAGLSYAVEGNTNLIGFHTEGNYGNATSRCYAIMGMVMFAEYIDGIAVVKVEASGSKGNATITSAAGTTAGTKISVTAPATLKGDWKYFLKAASAAPTAPDYKGAVDNTWTEIVLDEDGVADNVTGFTAGHKAVLVITNGSGQTIYGSAAAGVDIVNKA